jgi:hypothetical protein
MKTMAWCSRAFRKLDLGRRRVRLRQLLTGMQDHDRDEEDEQEDTLGCAKVLAGQVEFHGHQPSTQSMA